MIHILTMMEVAVNCTMVYEQYYGRTPVEMTVEKGLNVFVIIVNESCNI
jgi:uncharacterized protein (DUF302 family)